MSTQTGQTAMTETTPYGVERRPDGFHVLNLWTGRHYSGPFATREEAEAEAVRIKRERG